jgi:acyl-CoA synthetase (NDP forming)
MGVKLIRDVTPLVRPRTVAVVGASAKRASQGNIVIDNLLKWNFPGTILPVHPSAETIDGLPALGSIDQLPKQVDTAIVAIPAAGVFDCLDELERVGVRSAIVFANGFSAADEARIRAFGETSAIAVHGPNCMGLVNFVDAVPLYPSRPSLRIRPGRCSLIAQSGSAAISVMNSITVGLSKVVTVGSEFQLAAADYLAWLAGDDDTDVVGIVAESVKDPVDFADAVEKIRSRGKGLVVLKVGQSELGSAATKAHTGALVSNRDAYDRFFAECGVATVRDYDELVASMECLSQSRHRGVAGGVAVAGISGGQTALSCDVADELGVDLARFGTGTMETIRAALPGNNGRNPIDIGATVLAEARKTPEALRAVLADPSVGALAILQDSQASLNPITLQNYMRHIPVYADIGREAEKPVVVVSPTVDPVHEEIANELAAAGVPLLRGLRAGLAAIGKLGIGRIGMAGGWADGHRAGRAPHNTHAVALRRELSGLSGALPPDLCVRILTAYGVPFVRSIVVKDAGEAIARAQEVGFPMVVKIASPDILHRSDIGGVVLGVGGRTDLEEAIARIASNVRVRAPRARIEGFELQEQFEADAEAMIGFAETPPFGSLVVVGSGGTLVELDADRAVALAPVGHEAARKMIASTRLGKRLDGYRGLMPKTDIDKLAQLVERVAMLAHDLGDVIAACDLNPVLIRKGSGEVRLVDALMLLRTDASPSVSVRVERSGTDAERDEHGQPVLNGVQ